MNKETIIIKLGENHIQGIKILIERALECPTPQTITSLDYSRMEDAINLLAQLTR